jgi:hypothetical protein
MLRKATIFRRKTLAQAIPNVFCFNPAHISRLDARAQKGEEISLLQLRGRQQCRLTSYAVWAIISTDSS